MKMLTVFSAATALALMAPLSAAAQDSPGSGETTVAADNLSLAREVIDNGFPPETRVDTMIGVADQMIEQMIAADPQLHSDPALRPVIQRFRNRVIETTRDVLSRHIDDMMEAMAVAYADSFTQGELVSLLAFVSSPEGYGFLTRITNMNSHPAYAQATQAYMNEYLSYMPALQQELMQDVINTLTKNSAAKKR